MQIKQFFTNLKDDFQKIWAGLGNPNNEATTATIIDLLNKMKGFLATPAAATIEALIPDQIGTLAGAGLTVLINDLLPELEIGKDCAAAVKNLLATNPNANAQDKANTIIQTILGDISKLPASWQGDKWESIAVKLLQSVLNISTTAAKALVNIKYGEMQTKAAA